MASAYFNEAAFDKAVKKAVAKKASIVLDRAKELLVKQNDILSDKFASSAAFIDLKTNLRGEFGFTDEEVRGLDRIISAMKSDPSVTRIRSDKDQVILEWVDYDALKNHELAQHELTNSSSFGTPEIVSWVEWMEEGVTVHGYIFDESSKSKFSRSGEGLMKKQSGGLFKIAPSKILNKLGKSVKPAEFKRGLAAILKRR